MEDKLFSTVLPVLNGMLYVVMFSWLLIPILGMNGLYIANILNGLCCLLTVAAFAAAKIRRVPRNLNDLMAFPEDFGVSEKDYLQFTVREEKDIPTIAERVEKFCLDRGIERRKAVFSGLALEEMAGNILAHSFSSGKHSMEIRVTRRENDVILRLRDDGVPFSPSEQTRMADPEDGVKNVGLRILMDSAKEMQYQMGVMLAHGVSREIRYRNVLGLNVLMIRI